jgi:hypothetical protein
MGINLQKNPETNTIPFISLHSKSERVDLRKGWKWVPMIILQNHLAG